MLVEKKQQHVTVIIQNNSGTRKTPLSKPQFMYMFSNKQFINCLGWNPNPNLWSFVGITSSDKLHMYIHIPLVFQIPCERAFGVPNTSSPGIWGILDD